MQVAEHARGHGVRFPMLLDEGHAVADRFQVDRMCEVLVVDGGGWLRYRGALDDQYGRGTRKDAPVARTLLTRSTPFSRAGGCDSGHARLRLPDRADEGEAAGRSLAMLDPVAATSPTSTDSGGSVAGDRNGHLLPPTSPPIVQNKCQYCHRPGQAGPVFPSDVRSGPAPRRDDPRGG